MIDWAIDQGAGWIIFDDCDCVPTADLQQALRGIMEDTDRDIIMLYRLYIKGQDRYFPKMNDAGQSLYAWRTDQGVRAWEDNPLRHRMIGWEPGAANVLRLDRPLVCLHYFCPDAETEHRKLDFYRTVRDNPNAASPCQEGGAHGHLAPLPAWAKWKE